MTKNLLFFFSTTTVGGAETNIIKISRELSRRGYSIYWCFLVDNGPMLQLADFKVEVLETGLYYKEPQSFIKRYCGFIKKNKIDCVLNFGLRVELISRLLSKPAGAKKVISNIRSTDDWRKLHHTLLDKITRYSVDAWVSNSIAGKKAFNVRDGIPLSHIRVIYNFIDFETPPPNKSYNVDGVLRIGVLANITLEKGYLDLILLSKLLDQKKVKHIFICGGKDMMKGRFHKEVQENGLSGNFNLLGYVRDKTKFFQQVDIFLLPSYLEGMPTVVLEAMSNATPVIATNVGGIPELIRHDVNGYIVRPGDVQGMFNALRKLMESEVVRIVQNAIANLEKFGKSKIIDQWEEIIQ